ncbi:MAG: SpoIVB peptidase [Peptococcaceae bacterium]|nr:SpoIVB peptidase [Peptococcaceae bacterium]
MKKTGRIRFAAFVLIACAFSLLSLHPTSVFHSANNDLPQNDILSVAEQGAGERAGAIKPDEERAEQSQNLGLLHPNKPSDENRLQLLPGGQSIGISLQTQGVLVVGYAPILNEKNEVCYPAKEAGINIGDVVLSINGTKAVNDMQVAEQINSLCQDQQDISLEIKQGDKVITKNIKPIFCEETKRFRVGLYIRDEAAGVGTLTFMDPQSKIYGALGHVITDVDTHKPIDLDNGRVVESTIHSIEKSQKGQPGEKIGSFITDSAFQGSILKNSTSGIYGSYQKELPGSFYPQPIPIGYLAEVKKGPAKIYTVLHDNTIGEFDVEIEKVNTGHGSRNFVIRITDTELLEVTGGIVQGMSGSPIVQDSRLIGAVTHVFVNDATRGYGISIESMIKDSGIPSKDKAATALSGGFFLTFGYLGIRIRYSRN